MFDFVKSRLGGNLVSVYLYLNGSCKDDGAKHFSILKRVGGPKFRQDIRKRFFTCRVVTQWIWSSRVVVKVFQVVEIHLPSLEAFETQQSLNFLFILLKI